MAKSIRLLNVDYIVTSSDKTIDLNNLSGTGTGTNTYQADGHSSSATEAYVATGWPAAIDVDMINFDTKATSKRGDLAGSAGMKGSGGSNGTKGLFSRGGNNTTYNQIDEVAFGSTATITQFGTLHTQHDNGSSGSNGQVMMTVAGRSNGSAQILTSRVEKIAFDAGSTSSKIGDLPAASYRGADVSCQLYLLYVDRDNGSALRKISWDTGAVTTSANTLPNITGSGAGASNDSIGLIQGQGSTIDNTYIDQFNFASEAASTFAQSLNLAASARGATSNGTLALFAGASTSNVGQNRVEAVAFDSSSAAETWNNMLTSQQETKAISGG